MADKKIEEPKELTFAQKVIKVQKFLKVPKNRTNPKIGYSYRNAEDILNSVKPLLADEGLLLTITDEIVAIHLEEANTAMAIPNGVFIPSQSRLYVKATATITDGEKTLSACGYAREEEMSRSMAGAQITGTSSSYARKYALNGLFLIDDTADYDFSNDCTDDGVLSMTRKERIKYLLDKAKKCATREEMTKIWNSNQDLQSDADFTGGFTSIGKQKFPKQ